MNKTAYLIFLVAIYCFGCQSTDSDAIDNSSSTKQQDEVSSETTPELEQKDFYSGDLDLDEINTAYESCTTYYEEQTSNPCAKGLYKSWDLAINKYYKLAMELCGEAEKVALKKTQLDWIAFKEAEENFIAQALYENEGEAWKAKSFLTQIRTYDLAVQNFGESGEFDEYVGKQIIIAYGEDEYFETCDGYDGTNVDMRQCAYKTAQHYDEQLNENYKKIMAQLSEEHQELLRKAQRNWLKFKESDLARYDAIYKDMGGGTIYPTLQAFSQAELNRKRSIDFAKYNVILKE